MRFGLLPGLSQYAMDLGPISYHDFEHTTKGAVVLQRFVKDLVLYTSLQLI